MRTIKVKQPTKLYNIRAVVFQRKEHEPWEPGLMLNDGDLPFLDRYGKPVEAVFDYDRHASYLSLNIQPLLDNLAETQI